MKIETKVGLLFALAVVVVIGFAWLLGAVNPFANSYDLNLQYNFAGGIEVGSPIRVMGIKVGKVEKIIFDPSQKDAQGNEVKLRVVVSIDKKAKETIRSDSRFFINLAGIIGEKYIEVSPGSLTAPVIEAGSTIRGEDPPRIDQLISQGYGVAGKILEMLEKNEGSVEHTIKLFDSLVTNLNKTLVQLDKTTKNVEVTKLLNNMVGISDDIHFMTSKVRTDDGKKTMDLLHKLIWRLEPLDGKQIQKFLQDEGIRARLF